MPSFIRALRHCFVLALLLLIIPTARAQDGPSVLRSAKSGPWSAPATWDGGKVPGSGARVQIRPGHTVTYDLKAGPAIRAVQVAGTLTFARDRGTTLEVGVINIQPRETYREDGFDCDAHVPRLAAGEVQPALEIGTPHPREIFGVRCHSCASTTTRPTATACMVSISERELSGSVPTRGIPL